MALRRTGPALPEQPSTPVQETTAGAPGTPRPRAVKKSAASAVSAARKPSPWADSRESFPKRITVPLTEEDYRLLKHAQADDDIDTASRIRAMIHLWQTNARYRARIDRLARTAMRRRR